MQLIRRLRAVLVVAAMTSAGLVAGSSAGAEETQIFCGITITKSTVVANSILGCTDHGIIIDGDNITLDLNGNVIAGDGAGTVPSLEIGIHCVGGCTGVRIKNGTVRRFEVGVAFNNADQNVKVIGVTSMLNAVHGFMVETSGSTLRNNVALGNSEHGFAVDSSLNRIQGNIARENVDEGILVVGQDNQVLSNLAAENGASGIKVEGANNLVEGNTAVDNLAGDGLNILGADNVVSSNATLRNSFGVRLNGVRHQLSDNLAQDNSLDGFVINGTDHRSKHDRAIANARLGFSIGSLRHRILKAVARGNTLHGFQIVGESHVLMSSSALHNGDNGIELVVARDCSVLRNRANGNGFRNGISDGIGFGVSIGISVTNLTAKKNSAKGNDHPDQCSPGAGCS